MRRRSFFAGIAVAVAAVLGTRSRATAFDPTVSERDAKGRCVNRVYRRDRVGEQGQDGVWRLIRREDIRAGDEIILIGQDGDRLWRAERCTTDSAFADGNDGGSGQVTVNPDTVRDIMA